MKKWLVLVALLMGVVSTQAAVVYWTGDAWTNGGTDDYADGNSWSASFTTPYGTPPLSADSHGLITPIAATIWPTISSVIAETPDALGIGWDSDGTLNVVAGASVVFNTVYLPAFETQVNHGTLNISGGAMVANSLQVGWGTSVGTINQSGGTLHLGAAVWQNGVVNLSDTALFLINGDQTALDLVGNGWIQAPVAGQEVHETWNAGENWTEYTVGSALPDPFTAFTAANLIPNGDFSSTNNGTGGIPANLIGSNGDFPPFAGNTIDVVGWVPYFSDPSNLVSKTGSGGVLDGTFYLDTLFNNNITFNSSTYYLNGVVQSNALDGVFINSGASYELSIEATAVQYPDSQPTNAILTFALTEGTDVSNTNNAIALVQIDEATLPATIGTRQTTVVSGADLAAAMNSGPVNVLFNHLSEMVISDYPAVAPGDHQNADYNAQLNIWEISLSLVASIGDVNKDGYVMQDDVAIAQLYLDGDGGDSAAVRQDDLISQGYTTNAALAYLNLTDFDLDGNDYFDAAYVAAIAALVVPLELQIATTGSNLDFAWNSFGGKLYDLESTESLTTPSWGPYNDGVTVYEDIPGSGTGTNSLPGVLNVGPTRFFRVIEQ